MLCALRLMMVITLCFNMSYCQRRIVGMNYTSVDKRFMVYLIQSSQSRPKRHAWLCGGALVKTNKILTSAACLIESTNIYAIAGYRKYIKTAELDNDNCTKLMKRRVIRTCIPHGYDYDPSKFETWMTLDIGVAVVDKPYHSSDVLFRIICDYAPKPIPILYHRELIVPDTDVLAYGWGFRRGRRPSDPESDYNAKRLKYSNTVIKTSDFCESHFEKYEMKSLIQKYMLCTIGGGVMDDDGRFLYFGGEKHNCRRYGGSGENCDPNEVDNPAQTHETRRDVAFNTSVSSNETKHNPAHTNETRRDVVFNMSVTSNETKKNRAHTNETRRQLVFNDNDAGWGICQNDHGGPLVAYIGITEMLIGVAVNTVYDESYQCVGPALYTSTSCISNIVMCMLADNPVTRRAYEQIIKGEGFEIIQRDIEWADEPADQNTPAPASVDSEQEESATARIGNTTNS